MLSENHHPPLPGFKLSLLTKIHEIKSNKPRMTMMHVLVESIEKNKPELLQFYKKFDDITEVAKWVLTLEFFDISRLGKLCCECRDSRFASSLPNF